MGQISRPSSSDPDESFRVAPGDVLGEKFRVEHVLGQGGMGRVVAAMHLQLKERVALKFLLPSGARRPDHRARFLREAQATAKIRNEHVARVIDVGTLEGDLPYIVMEYLEGQDLQAILLERRRLPVAESVDLILQAMEGVAAAHVQGIIHRDLKPSNLFVTLTRNGERVLKVLDFGISKMISAGDSLEESNLTNTRAVIGSPMYMSPEQIRSASSVDTRTDVWSLGLILYEMLTGKFVWKAENSAGLCAVIAADDPIPMRNHFPDLPSELDALVMRALAKPLDQRIQNVGAFATDLAKLFPTEENLAAADQVLRVLTGARRRVPPSPTSGNYAIAEAGDVLVRVASVSPPLASVEGGGAGRSPRGVWVAGAAAVAVVAVAGAFALRPSAPPGPSIDVPAAPAPAATRGDAPLREPAPPAASVVASAPPPVAAAASSAPAKVSVPKGGLVAPKAPKPPNPFADRE